MQKNRLVNGRYLKDHILPLIMQGWMETFWLRTQQTQQGLRLRLQYTTAAEPCVDPNSRPLRRHAARNIQTIADLYEERALKHCMVRKAKHDPFFAVQYVWRTPGGDDD